MKNLYPILRIYLFLLILPVVSSAKSNSPEVLLKHQDFEVSYSENGVGFFPKSGQVSWKWKLRQISGIEQNSSSVQPLVDGKDVRFYRGNITEQYVFKGSSIEQQFIINRQAGITGDLVIEGQIESNGDFARADGGWSWTNGLAKVYMGDVFVFDASGKSIPASMQVTGQSSRIVVGADYLKNATFPVVIDPQIGPDDFVLANSYSRSYQPRLIYNSTVGNQNFFASFTSFNSSNSQVNITGGSFNLQQVKSKSFSVDQVCNYPTFDISGASPSTQATKSDVAASSSAYLAVWEDFQGPAYGNQKIKYRLNDKSATNGTVKQVFKSTTFATNFGWAENPAVAGNDQKFLITAVTGSTTTNYKVFGKYITNSGLAESLDSLELVSASEAIVDNEVDARPGGSFYVAAATLQKLYFGIAPSSGSLTPNSLATSGNIGTMALAVGNSKELLVWSELSSGKYIIKGLWLTSSGTASGSPFQIDDINYYGSGFPSVAYNPDSDSWLVVWHSSPLNMAGTMIFGREILANETMNTIFPISKQSRTSVTPTVAYDTQNHEFWIAWSGGGNKDQLLAQRWTSSMSDCIISLKRDTIHENNYKGAPFNPATDKFVTSLKAYNSQGDSIYPLDFIIYPVGGDDGSKFQISYLQASNTQTPTITTLDDIHLRRNKLFYTDNNYINYEAKDSYSVTVYAQSETTGQAGSSSTQTQPLKVVDMNEQMSATFSSTVSFLEDQVSPKIPFSYDSGDNGSERNPVLLSVTATPAMFTSAPTMNFNPSVPDDGHGNTVSRTQLFTSEELLFALKKDISGTQTLTFSLTDQKSGVWSATQKENVKNYSISVTVIPVNDAPSFTSGGNVAVNEDCGPQTISAWATNLNKGATDESGQTLSFTVTNDNNALFNVQPSITSTGSLLFTPNANAFGTATVTVVLKDDGGTANGGIDQSGTETFTITVNPVNDEPTFTKGSDQSIFEDSGTQTVASWASGMTSGPSNESSQVLTFTVTNNNNSLFDVQPSVNVSTGDLTYSSKANAFGTATVTVVLSDDGGTANGGVDSSTQTFTISILPVNDVPVFTNGGDQSVLEDCGSQTTTAWATGISPGDSFESGQALQFFISNNNTALFSVQPSVDPLTGTLTFTPSPNASGTATVTIRLQDDGGTANGGVNSTASETFTITVQPVNDAPSFSLGMPPITYEDSGARTFPGWVSGVSTGPSNESGQVLSITVTTNKPELFSAQPMVDLLTGDLTFTPAPDAFGVASLTVTLFDNGGTLNGGVDSYTQSSYVGITSINDSPSFTAGGDQLIPQGSGTQTVTSWATNISPGASNESDQVLTFILTNTNNTLFAIQPAINSTDGTLTYTPQAGSYGTATVTVQLKDNGGILSSAIDVSGTSTFTITILPVNHAPSFTAGGNLAVDEDSSTQTVTWATNISAGPSYESGQTVTFYLNNNNSGLFSDQPKINSSGVLTFLPAANQFGTATLTIYLKDDGGTINGGADQSGVVTFTITINPINDKPRAVDSAVSGLENIDYIFKASDFSFADAADPTDRLKSVSVAVAPDKGTLLFGGNAVTTFPFTFNVLQVSNLVFRPASYQYGSPYTLLNFRVSDDNSTNASNGIQWSDNLATLNIEIVRTSNPPTAENQYVYIETDSEYSFEHQNFGFSDPDLGNKLGGVKIESLPNKGQLLLNGNPILQGTIISANELSGLVYKPNPGERGELYASFSFRVQDFNELYPADEKLLSLNAYTFFITVRAINHVPGSLDKVAHINNGGIYSFSSDDFPLVDTTDKSDLLSSIEIELDKTEPNFRLNGKIVKNNLVVPVDSIRFLKFEASGYAGDSFGFRFRVTDNNSVGALNGELQSLSAYSFTIILDKMNSAPTLVKRFVDIDIPEFEEFLFKLGTDNFTDPDGDKLTYQINIASGSWIVKSGDTQLQGLPLPSADNQAVVTVRATDPSGLWAEDSFNVNVVRKKRPLIFGQISGSGIVPEKMAVGLFKYSAVKPDSVALTKTVVSDYFYFENVSVGQYLVKAINNQVDKYPQVVSTYYTSTIDWTKATKVEVIAGGIYQSNISLYYNQPTSGTGSISGFVRSSVEISPAQNGSSGSISDYKPYANADVILTIKGNSLPLLYTQSAADGSYKFSNLPVGEYVVAISVPGFQSKMTYTLKIEDGKLTFENVNFTIYLGDSVITDVNTGIPSVNVSLYPNPTTGLVNIACSQMTREVRVRVMDMNGHEVIRKQFDPENLIQVRLDDLLSGTYMVEVRSGDFVKTFHVILMKAK